MPDWHPDILDPEGTVDLNEVVGTTETEPDGDEDDDGADRKRKKRKFLRSLARITPWKMKDLTIKSYTTLARKLVAEKQMWKQFSDFM